MKLSPAHIISLLYFPAFQLPFKLKSFRAQRIFQNKNIVFEPKFHPSPYKEKKGKDQEKQNNAAYYQDYRTAHRKRNNKSLFRNKAKKGVSGLAVDLNFFKIIFAAFTFVLR